MKILFHLGHQAHFHLFKNVIANLKTRHTIYVLIKKKDILEELLNLSGIPYYNILPSGRKDGIFGIFSGILIKDFNMFRFCLKNKPDLLIGTSAEISHVGKLLSIPSINVNEDDVKVIKTFSNLTYPYSDYILSPKICNNEKWNYKTINYNGYHELAYLHPNHFIPDINIVRKYIDINKPYFILRFAKLNAHHDKGISGINNEIAKKIINILCNYGDIYITSERALNSDFEKYRLQINLLDIHHVLKFSKLYIGDSQTMAAEAGVLGTPFIRFNDFVGRISYLTELEKDYGLGFGFNSHQVDEMLLKIEELLEIKDLSTIWAKKRERLLKDKIDVAKFMIWFFENYPSSLKYNFEKI